MPTEAEWEYAARAGTATAYSFGADATNACDYANGMDRAAKRKYPAWTVNEACDDKFADLAPVGHFDPNPWLLYDIHGNVWEWVWDWYGEYQEAPAKDYAGPTRGRERVVRGGSFNSEPWGLRSSYRDVDLPSDAFGVIGFRCARGSRPSP